VTTYKVYGNPTDEYVQAPPMLEVVDGRDFIGYAQRTGITPPHYPNRAVYKFKETYYVYEDGELVPTAEWKQKNQF
jgi:hypothetical protein